MSSTNDVVVEEIPSTVEPITDTAISSPPPPAASTTETTNTPIVVEPKNKKQKKTETSIAQRKANMRSHIGAKKVLTSTGYHTSPTAKQIMNALSGKLKLSDHIINIDNKGTKWLGKTYDDEPPKKLIEIPTDNKHNEIEFINWQLVNGKFAPNYLLFTNTGSKYWANTTATMWLEAAKVEGKVPGNCTFVVKNTKDAGLLFGFRYADEIPSISADIDTVNTPPLNETNEDGQTVGENIDIALD